MSVSTQIATSPQYAVALVIDALTGERVLNGASFARGYPMVEVAVRVLKTAKGSLPHNIEFGTDMSMLDVMRSNIGADYRAAVINAFSYYTKRGLMTQLTVDTEVQGTFLGAVIQFYDPRARKNFTFRGSPRTGFALSSQ